MSAVFKGYPDIHLSGFPTSGWDSSFYTEVPGTLSNLPSKEEQLLDFAVSHLLKEKDQWDSDNVDQRRTLQNIKQMSKSLEIKSGTCLVSIFSFHHSKIGKEIETEIVDDIDMPEHTDAPSNSDYNLDYLSETEYVEFDDENYNIITEGVPGKMVFSVEHKSRKDEPTVPCSHCHQSGVVKCPECNGTGREQYEAGNYSTGETRVRTTACHECGGTGKIPCPKCNGTGKIEIYAANYSVVKSVKELSSIRVNAGFTISYGNSERILSTPNELEKMDFCLTISTGTKLLKLINKKGEISFLKKNRKDYIEDNRENILNELSDLGLEELYKKNEERLQADLSNAEKIRGAVFCRKEINYSFPVLLLIANYGEWDKQEFIFYEEKGMIKICALNVGFTSSGDAFKLKIKSLFKK